MASLFFVEIGILITQLINVDGVPATMEYGLGLFQNKCISDLGCFYNGPPFYHPLHRPISYAPEEVETLRTRYLFFSSSSRSNRELERYMHTDPLKNSSFDPEKKTKFLVHGYNSDVKESNLENVKDVLVRKGDYNVFLIDWRASSTPPYSQAVANARVVAAQTAKFIEFLMSNFSLDPQDVHLIGHSLGAHLCGWIGERIPNLGRITGLDPASFYFHEADTSLRLDPSDANFVDVIHTDGANTVLTGAGLSDPIGHIDFYPNGGRSQPGCSYVNHALAVLAPVLNTCDHSRAIDFFKESITNEKCRFLSVACDSFYSYQKGYCTPVNSEVAEMGIRAAPVERLRQNSKFFLKTSSSKPFCISEQ